MFTFPVTSSSDTLKDDWISSEILNRINVTQNYSYNYGFILKIQTLVITQPLLIIIKINLTLQK